MDFFIGHFNYWIVIILMMVGLYTVISRGNLIKKIIGLNIFQVSVFLLYISLGTRRLLSLKASRSIQTRYPMC